MEPVYYLKVNRDCDYAFFCIQFWIDVAEAAQAFYFIICDKESLKQKIIETCKIKDSSCFIESATEKASQYSKYVATVDWQKAANAHLTTYIHAKENNFGCFWNIDADDTSFLLSPEKTAHALKCAAGYAKRQGVDTMSLDMWKTIRKGSDWSFGITYVNMLNRNWLEVIETHKKDKKYKTKKYCLDNFRFNVDQYFYYLQDNQIVPLETFYFNNSHFIHWGIPYAPLHYWYLDKKIILPRSILGCMANNYPGGVKMVDDTVVVIDVGLKVKDSQPYLRDSYLKKISSSYGKSPTIEAIKQLGVKNLSRTVVRSIKKRISNG